MSCIIIESGASLIPVGRVNGCTDFKVVSINHPYYIKSFVAARLDSFGIVESNIPPVLRAHYSAI
jgi:hypothetical protein